MNDNHFFTLDGPLDSLPASRQMRTANLSGFPGLVRSLGADPVPMLERHEIDPQSLRDPDHFVDCKSVIDLFEYSSASLNDPLFGLHLAASPPSAGRRPPCGSPSPASSSTSRWCTRPRP